MASTEYTTAEIHALWDSLSYLAPKELRLARTLITFALSKIEPEDTDVRLRIDNPNTPDGTTGADPSDRMRLVFDSLFTPGADLDGDLFQAGKVGNVFVIAPRPGP